MTTTLTTSRTTFLCFWLLLALGWWSVSVSSVSSAASAAASSQCQAPDAEDHEDILAAILADDDDDDDDDIAVAGSCGGGGGIAKATKAATATTTVTFPTDCGLYMAVSSIPGAGWGVYTAVPIASGDIVHPVDVAVQVVDYDQQHQHQHQQQTPLPSWLMHEYYWRSSTTYADFDAADVDSVMPGFGMLANSHTGLVNVNNDGALLRQPGSRQTAAAGATSHYQHVTFSASSASASASAVEKDIVAGHELFVEYGDEWFAGRSAVFGNDLPLSDSYRTADLLLQQWEFAVDGDLDSNIARDVWSLVEHVLELKQKAAPPSPPPSAAAAAAAATNTANTGSGRSWTPLTMTAAAAAADSIQWPPSNERLRLAAAMPANYTHAVRMTLSPVTVAYETVPNVIRSPAWLLEHGKCLDHIQPMPTANVTVSTTVSVAGDNSGDQPSSNQKSDTNTDTNTDSNTNTTYNMGMGAFATRLLKAGTVVAPAPVLHLHRQHLEWQYVPDPTSGKVEYRGQQLLVNYCFGHPDSSLLLFPYSPAVNLINHAPSSSLSSSLSSNNTNDTNSSNTNTTATATAKANVAIRWSDDMMANAKEWLEQWTSDEVLQENKKAGLMMEFYALTDIQEGEQVLLDYGEEWQQAWDEHVLHWKAPANADSYVSAWDYDHRDIIPLETDDDYPPSWIQVRCFADSSLMGDAETDVLDEFYGFYNWTETDSSNIEDTVPCRVMSAEYDDDGEIVSYRVALMEGDDDDGEGEDDEEVFVKEVPWQSITFVEKEYTGNQFLRQAFRHEIRLPDEMVPAKWRDLEAPDTCGLYMAESSIPNAGLGVYTTRQFQKEEKLFSGDVVIQVEDFYANTRLRHWFAGETKYEEEPEWLLSNYFWNAVNTMGVFEAGLIESIVPGLGMLANSHPGLVNAMMQPPETVADLHRGRDPGAGGSTLYHNIHFVASEDIVPGAEIFVEYGDSWFQDRTDLGAVPLSGDYRRAKRILTKFMEQVDGDTDSELAKDIWDVVLVALSGERTGAAIPKNISDIEHVLETGTAENSVPNRIRSTEWLEENGLCLDHIRPGLSTIKQAGRGAFATRKIQKGKVIAPIPMVHVRRRHMEVYDSNNVDEYDGFVTWEGKQLLDNYVYGHPESSLLLFPYSPVINYVNHNAAKYNAELRWSTLSNHHTDWLERTPDDLDSEDHAGLIMELVATRNIEPGEEVFLHYGESWDNAWNDYVEKEWEPTGAEKRYVSAAELNQRMEWLETIDEVSAPSKDVFTLCFAGKFSNKLATTEQGPKYEWHYFDGLYRSAEYAFPCDILEREFDTSYENAVDRSESIEPVPTTYTVLLDRGDGDNAIVVGIPRNAIRFFDDRYASDLFLRSAFRHEIGIPDHMVPAAWRDIDLVETS